MNPVVRLSVRLLAMPLACCGKPLGKYEVRDVRIVPGSVVKQIEPSIDADPQMLRIEFTSVTNLYDASDGGDSGLYVMTRFCPFERGKDLSVGETYYNDRQRTGPARVLERRTLSDGRVIETVTAGEKRRPMKDVSGKYVYTTYLRLRREGSATADDERFAFMGYDLSRQTNDLCLRIDHPGYYIPRSRSQVFTIPAAMIQRALATPAG